MSQSRPLGLLTGSVVPTALLLAGPTLCASAQGFDPAVAPDLDPDPNVVEIDLVAGVTTWQYVPGVDTTVWAYNGTVPGPTIEAEVGNLLRVNFRNELPEPTTVHWHGVEVPADMDGSHVSQLTVQPGESFTYEFELLRDSLYWYHPHVRPFDQVEKGLYGCLLVRDPEKEAEFGLAGIEEHIVVFDDVLLDSNLQVVPAFSFTDPIQNALYQLNGREGNVVLVNGRDASEVTLNVANGQPQRWRVLNAANTTFCRLDVNDMDVGMNGVQIWEIGSDGGFLEEPFARPGVTGTAPVPTDGPTDGGGVHPGQVLIKEMMQGIFLYPGERMDVVFTPRGNDGDLFRVVQADWFRGRHVAVYDSTGQIRLPDDPLDGNYPAKDFLQLSIQGPDPGTPEHVPSFSNPFPPLSPAVGEIPVTFGHSFPNAEGDVTLFAQADFSTGTMIPLPAPKVSSFEAKDVHVGETWDWKVTNLTHGDHPFHSHGFFFELLEYRFEDDIDILLNQTWNPTTRRLKDVIRIPPRLGFKGTSRTFVTLRTTFDDAGREGRIVAQGERPTFEKDGSWTSGGWLFHCHILEHSAKGMLSFIEVHDPADPFVLLGEHLAGTHGLPSLTGQGTPGARGPLVFELVNALPNTSALFVASTTAAREPLAGGTLVPGSGKGSQSFSRRVRTDALGCATIRLPQRGSLPSGTEIFAQVVFQDPGAVGGTAFSNAVSFEVP